MQDPTNPLARAAKGQVENIAADLGMSAGRLYQKLDGNCPWPFIVAFCRAVGRYNPDGLREILTDFAAVCGAALPNAGPAPELAELHAVLAAVMAARLENETRAVRLQHCRRAVSCLEREIAALQG